MAEQIAEEKTAAAEKEAHASLVKKAEDDLKAARDAQLKAATPKITSFAGIANGPFVIYGENLAQQREIRIGGHLANISSRRPGSIKGVVPPDVKPGTAKVMAGVASFDGKVSA